MISIGNDKGYNVCPTDLHGSLDEKHYMISLRKNGKLNAQVNQHKRLLLGDIDASYYKETYPLGKNHMQDLKELKDHASLTDQYSTTFKLPIPTSCIEYKELRWIESLEIGLHQVHLFSIENKESVHAGSRLMHIHAYYAQWRKQMGLLDPFLIR